MIFNQLERIGVKACCQGNAIDSCIHRCAQTGTQGFAGRVHRQLFHAVDENETVALLLFHRTGDMQPGGFFNFAQIENDTGFILLSDQCLELEGFVLRIACSKIAIG